MKRECGTYMDVCISIYFKTLCVNVHVYVYTCVWIRIIQARKPLWRWSWLIPGKTPQPDCSVPCPVECWALPDVKKFSWYWIGTFFPAPCDCCLCPTTMHLWGQSDIHTNEYIWAHTHICTQTHTQGFFCPSSVHLKDNKQVESCSGPGQLFLFLVNSKQLWGGSGISFLLLLSHSSRSFVLFRHMPPSWLGTWHFFPL